VKRLYDLLFGDPRAAYARARANTTPADTGIAETLASLDGKDSFHFGSLLNGAAVRLAPDVLGHGLTCGSSGSGKSSALSLIVEGFAAAPGHRAEVIDPKGETCIVLAEHAAMTLLRLPQPERETFARRFQVIDVRADAVTPANLFAVPPQMSPALLASLRASAMVNAGEHEFSDLMQHGLFLVFSVAIALQRGITKKFVRRLLLDDAFRQHTLAPKIHDAALRDSIEHLDDVLPTATRQALVRQFDMHLSTRLGRIWFGLSPAAVARLAPASPDPRIVIGNFGPSLLLSPSLARTQAVNRLIDVLTATMVNPNPVATLLLIEEIGTLVRHPAVARFLLEALRTLRWKLLSIVCCAQDPTNAIPKDVLHALLLNMRWLLAFESGRDDASILLPYLPPRASDGERKPAFLAEMATLPPQHCYFLRKGLPPLRMKTRDLPEPKTSGKSRDELLDIFYSDIASHSMVRVADAERLIDEEERDLATGDIPPQSPQNASGPVTNTVRTVEDLFALLGRNNKTGDPP
jgi:hypothetical protein